MNSRDLGRLFHKIKETLKRPQKIGPQMWHITVPQIPYRKIACVDAINRHVSRMLVRRAMRLLRFGRSVSWFNVPHPGFLAGQLNEELVVYYCTDDYAAHPGVDPIIISKADEMLTIRADRVFVAPPALLAAKQALNNASVYSPHGVDTELFGRANDARGAIPALLADRPRPIVGFFGSLADWIDIELVAYLARARPNYTFVLVGQSFTDTTELSVMANVLMPGPQPYEELPNWARAFNAAIIPYRLNQQVFNANPLKLREYLATGVPIVSVSSPEIDKFSQYIQIATSREAFLAAVDAAISENDADARRRRIESVRAMSWDARFSAVMDIVASDLRGKSGG